VLVVTSMLFVALAAPAAAAAGGLALEPAVGPPTTLVQAEGSGFAPSELVALSFDGARVGSAVTSPTGTVHARLSLPAAARPGDHRVEAVGEASRASASAPFLVRTDWLQGCFDSGRSCTNPYENVIGPSNVGALAETWRTKLGADGATSPVYVEGVLFVGTAEGVVGLDAVTGEIVVKHASAPVTQPPIPIRAFDPQPDPPGKLVFGSRDGILHAISLAGDPLWQASLGAPPTAPLVPPCSCKLIVGAGHTVFAFDGDGKRLWATTLKDGTISEAAAMVSAPQERVIVAAGHRLYSLDAATGPWSGRSRPRAAP
jgi:hypothetical protein